MKKNIGIIIDNDFYTDNRVLNEVRILSEYFNVFVLCFRYDKNPPYPPLKRGERCVSVKQIYINRKVKDILFGIQNTIPIYDCFWVYHITKFVKQYSLESIHLHDLYMSKIGWLVKKKTGVHFILDLHENYPEAVLNYKWANHTGKRLLAKPKKWGAIEELLLSYPDKIIVLSEGFKNTILDKYPILKSEQISIYPNVPDLQEFKEYSIVENIFDRKERFIIFYFGVISERRGIVTCIEAVHKLKEKYPQIHLLLIGPVDKAEKSDLTLLFNDVNITHYSWKDISLLPSYIHISDICICPIVKNEQHDSGIANKVFQYALCGKPIIVSNSKPQAEFVETNNCGLVFRSGESDDLVEKIEYLINNPDKCKEFGTNGKTTVVEKYNVDVYRECLLKVYDNNINHP